MLDNVTINQLRAFVAVCDQGSFSGAARQLNRAQSAISHAIKALESAFDVQLFERNTRKATLTAAGRSLLPDARAVISRTEEMKTRAVSIAEAGVPQVSIAVDTYFPRAHLIECLRSLQADFPTVAINLSMTTMRIPASAPSHAKSKNPEGPPCGSNNQDGLLLLDGCPQSR